MRVGLWELVPDDTSVPNPTSDKPAPRHGPIG
jgi:hypothetical protein